MCLNIYFLWWVRTIFVSMCLNIYFLRWMRTNVVYMCLNTTRIRNSADLVEVHQRSSKFIKTHQNSSKFIPPFCVGNTGIAGKIINLQIHQDSSQFIKNSSPVFLCTSLRCGRFLIFCIGLRGLHPWICFPFATRPDCLTDSSSWIHVACVGSKQAVKSICYYWSV